jgi:hypothetical protein
LQHHVAVLDEGISHLSVQRIDFISSHDPSLTLNQEDIADRPALQAQLHSASLDLKV